MTLWLQQDIDTPTVMINLDILKNNINQMARFAANHQLQLRPHIKTHKMREIAEMQISAGAIGITTAKIGEAEIMAELGMRDILIAYPIVGNAKLNRLHKLMEKADVITVLDGLEQAEGLSQYAKDNNVQFNVLIEVDTGLNRCGVQPGDEAVKLFKAVSILPGVTVKGIMTHAGHAYGAQSYDAVKEIARQEGDDMIWTARMLEDNGSHVQHVSVGATPTVRISGTISGVTEIRPGNYVFNDMTQVRLGVASVDDCSLRVAARVVARPAADRLIIDAGAKTLALDQGAHGTQGVSGYGKVVSHPECCITRLSEEHGIIQINGSTMLKVGDIIEIIPNHSCPVVNLTDEVEVVQNGRVIRRWSVAARGKTS